MPPRIPIPSRRPTRRLTVRTPRRRVARSLEQIPVWTEPVGAARGLAEPGEPATGLDALLDGLNPEQLRAVTHGQGPQLVVAGAGTGKTQVVTRRIAWLIATRLARPSEILALTFTDRAAAEMQARVDRLVPYGYTDSAISTFHAFGDRLIREYALEVGRAPDVRVLSRVEVVIFLRDRLFDFELDRSGIPPASWRHWPRISAGSRMRTSIRRPISPTPIARSARRPSWRSWRTRPTPATTPGRRPTRRSRRLPGSSSSPAPSRATRR